MPCSAWPNSWNIVVTSSKLISAGWPAAGLVKFSTLNTTGLVPRNVDWFTRFDIHAPPFLLSRFHGSIMKIASGVPSASMTSNTRMSGLQVGMSFRSLKVSP